MAGYVFIGNSTKPSAEKSNIRSSVFPVNVSCIEVAMDISSEVFLGTN